MSVSRVPSKQVNVPCLAWLEFGVGESISSTSSMSSTSTAKENGNHAHYANEKYSGRQGTEACELFNTLRPRRNEQYFADDIFKRIFFNENVWISIKISLKFVPKGPINNSPALVQIMAWRRSGDKPLSEPMLIFVPTHICVTRPQWVKWDMSP